MEVKRQQAEFRNRCTNCEYIINEQENDVSLRDLYEKISVKSKGGSLVNMFISFVKLL